ncbi:MAG: hypothetical protein EB116_19085 [Betaproteobacteria bacterium]|nr:hypothetical protein [Betaproteobacteria bacterium]
MPRACTANILADLSICHDLFMIVLRDTALDSRLGKQQATALMLAWQLVVCRCFIIAGVAGFFGKLLRSHRSGFPMARRNHYLS